MTLGRNMAEWARALRYRDLSARTVHEAKRRVLDCIAACLGAYRALPARIACTKALATHYPPPAATVWGTRRFTTPELAAFANGTMVRYLDFNDTYVTCELAHPSDNIPAAVAVTQATRKTGRDLILAVVIGYEIQCRLCDAASLRAGGWDQVTYGALSTALLAGRVWDCSADELEHALGIAGVSGIAMRQTHTGPVSDWRACGFAGAARHGIFAADLARRGLTGPGEIFEGPAGLMRQLGIAGAKDFNLGAAGDLRIGKTHIKCWPAGYQMQSAIDACLQLRPQVEGRRITEIRVAGREDEVRALGPEFKEPRPLYRETANHSLSYCCAATLVDGDITPETFDESRLKDPKILDLIDRTTIVEAEVSDPTRPDIVPRHITITCADGTRAMTQVSLPRGHAENPMTDEDITAKFRRLATGVISDASAAAVLEQVWTLDRLGDVTPLFAFEILDQG